MQHTFSNTAQPYRWLFPRGAVTKFRQDEPFYRDPFLNSKYGFGCGVYRLKETVVDSFVTDSLEEYKSALATIPESDLWGGGRVGLYMSMEDDRVVNYVVVFAGLTEEQEKKMMASVESYQLNFVLNKTKAMLVSPLDPHAPHRETYKNPAITNFSNAVHKFDEWGQWAQLNRNEIAAKVASALNTTCSDAVYECVYTSLFDMVLFNDVVGPKPNTHIAYDDVRKPVLVRLRRAFDTMDKTFQAIPVVARWKDRTGKKDPRFFGESSSDTFETLDLTEFDRFKLMVTLTLQPISVRCSESRYDAWVDEGR